MNNKTHCVDQVKAVAVTPGQMYETHEMICGKPCPVIVYHDDDGYISSVFIDIGSDLVKINPGIDWIAITQSAIQYAIKMKHEDSKDETVEQLRRNVRMLSNEAQRLRDELDKANGVIR